MLCCVHSLGDAVMKGINLDEGVKGESRFLGNLHFGPSHMLLLEEKLSVQVAYINSVKINL